MLTPEQSERRYELWNIGFTNHTMLVRSFRGKTMVDVTFTSVEYVDLPLRLNGFRFVPPNPEEVEAITPLLKSPESKIYILESAGERYVVAASGVEVEEEKGDQLSFKPDEQWRARPKDDD